MTRAPDGPLRIAALVATYPPYRGGTGNMCFSQSAELIRRGHDVVVLTAGDRPSTTEAGPPVVRRTHPLYRIGNAPLIPSMVAARGFDVLHVYQPFIFGAELATFGALLSRTPVVSSYYNELRETGVKGALFRGYNATASRFALRRSDRVTVLSLDHGLTVPVLAEEHRRRPDVFDEVPGAVDPHRFSPGDAPQLRRRYGIAPDAVVAIACASLDHAHAFKRVDVAVTATAALAAELPVQLLVVGDGPLRQQHMEVAAALGISDRVTFAGPVPEAELADHYRAADFLLLPSDSTESFGLVQVEAMACAKPVVVSALPGVRTVSVDGEDGLHIRPGDAGELAAAMRRLVEIGPEERARMGARGRARVLDRFTWERSTDALERSLRSAVAARRG